MDTTLCGLSAWDYLRTPAMLREVEMPAGLARSAGMPHTLLSVRHDARDADRLVSSRLLTTLKGVSLPVNAITGSASSSHASRLVVPYRCSNETIAEFRIDLGGGLYVLSPEAMICCLASTTDEYVIAKMMFEACGLFSLLPPTRRLVAFVGQLVHDGVLTKEACPCQVFGYSDERGRPLPTIDPSGEEIGWAPSFDRKGRITDLWKRPPLTSVEKIGEAADAFELGQRHPVRRALAMVCDGAASPAEVKANLLLCAKREFGGEAWERPHLNRKILFSAEAVRLAHQSQCFADSLWMGSRGVLEIQGEAFHADEEGFRVASGRTAALESMGYSVAELLNEQLASLELWDAVLPTLAKKLGFDLEPRTERFLRKRTLLHRALFGAPYEPRALRVSARRPSRRGERP